MPLAHVNSFVAHPVKQIQILVKDIGRIGIKRIITKTPPPTTITTTTLFIWVIRR